MGGFTLRPVRDMITTYSQYGFSSIGSWLNSTIGKGLKTKTVLHSFNLKQSKTFH